MVPLFACRFPAILVFFPILLNVPVFPATGKEDKNDFEYLELNNIVVDDGEDEEIEDDLDFSMF